MVTTKQDTTVPAHQLLEQYTDQHCFFWSSPWHTLLAEGSYLCLPEVEQEELSSLSHRVTALLQQAYDSGQAQPVLVGAIPFDPELSPARLVIPQQVQWAAPRTVGEWTGSVRSILSDYELQEVPAAELYKQGVEEALVHLRQGDLEKVVLSRSLELTSSAPIPVAALLHNLAAANTHGYTFAVHIPLEHERQLDSNDRAEEYPVWIGASPELLIRKEGRRFTANPLAGSAARSADPQEDRRRAEALLVSAKDRHEHAVVIDAVVAALRPYCGQLEVPNQPSLVQTETMWHLSTEISGVLDDPSITSLELAAALHPTPAICGTPTEAARDLIRQVEPFDRGMFTGMVGWCNKDGDGEWAVTIRCAEVCGPRLRLYAGAGIVAASTAEAELAETSAKLRTMLRAMRIDEASAQPAGRERE
ncbi:isochorismate synthase DhbC [Paenibacillus bovis]|uniref:isochorismate synthase n=1 Tax=Paenibacillus bovis TaxID=1616788 RepID=A0A172ZKG6_9BACL|nr:isochorismate synthase DhbC [Paenibacillus bovis]ANF98088.1 isochorismate synthase [Paenibacillus bovis]